MPRDCDREAQELRILLDKAGIPAPYVLVGHSLGALNAQAFAALHRELVAGLVLLDPPPRSFIQGQAHPGLRAMAEAMTAQWQALADSGAAFGDLPLDVLASGKPNPAFGEDAAAFQRDWIEQSRALAGLSTNGRFTLAETSSHNLYRDEPDLVEQRIVAVLQEAHARRLEAKMR